MTGPKPRPSGPAEVDETAYRDRIAALEGLTEAEELPHAAEQLTAILSDLDAELGEQPDR